nr:hypothetical protein [Phytohabitans houttuyneae]
MSKTTLVVSVASTGGITAAKVPSGCAVRAAATCSPSGRAGWAPMSTRSSWA